MRPTGVIGGALLLAVLRMGAAVAADAPTDAPAVDYLRDVQPIFQAHCLDCHGPDAQESGLRLDTAALAKQGGDRGKSVVAGKSEDSVLYQALVGKGDVSPMPYDLPQLEDEQIAAIRRWIDAGAPTPAEEVATARNSDHWSFQPVRRPAPPAVRTAQWVRNDIDRFILARLEAANIEPSPAADRATLIRRVSFDLRGLPPTIAELDEFLADDRPDAYERMIDRLLASPHYGERWGRHWLDLARYGDSNGFTIDSARQMWKYRDWVIDAINRDLPFDQFATEQLAGDMLPNATDDQLIATGFHRNTLFNEEGGTDREQFRVETIVDRVNTTGAVFLGLTVGCAQCHSHKFDPITQREYYQLYAIFNNCSEPRVSMPDEAQKRRLEEFKAEIAAASRKLAAHDAELLKGLSEWERLVVDVRPVEWETPALVGAKSENGTRLALQDDRSLLAKGQIPEQDTYTLEFETQLEQVAAVRLEVLTHASLPGTGPGLAPNGNFILGEFEVAAAPLVKDDGAAEPADFVPVELARAVADHSQEGHDIARAIDGDPVKGWAINVTGGSLHADRVATFFPKAPVRHAGGARLRVVLRNGDKKYAVGRFRVTLAAKEVPETEIPADVHQLVVIPPEKRTKPQQEELAAAFLERDAARRELAAEVKRLQTERDNYQKRSVTAALILREDAPRQTFVHIRGDFLKKGDQVGPGVPAVLPGFPSGVERPTRLDLARWLFAPDNPLTARVAVNRFWQRFFGAGLVETENDFGTQGEKPSHPELLDWLASEFREEGWSVKAMHRLIVTSATYRQASRVRSDLETTDPRNKLLARQQRLRIEAEIVRDAALAASGLLVPKVGGPSVFPPHPGGLDKFTQSPKNWKASADSDRYRRGLYTYFWRSSPHPFLMTFDAPDGNTTCTRRVRSNTPLQALTLANDQAFVEFAQGLAGRIMALPESDPASRAQEAFRLCVSRPPTERELSLLVDFHERQKAAFGERPEEAKRVAPAARPAGVSPEEAAAWTATARVLLNLDEFITRE
ncbi:MAG: PSD1 and planctomycete cytochrome C domain-containing protein [Planctomycetales bacterium]